MTRQDIAITGEGIICAIGTNKTQVLSSLLFKQSGIDIMRFLPSIHKELPVGEVKLSNDALEARLGLPHSALHSRTALLGMTAVDEALRDAAISQAEGRRVILISGTTVAGMDVTERFYQDMKGGRNLQALTAHDCGGNTRDIARHFGVFSDYVTLSTACSSAANAIILGAWMLQAGDADIVVAGGCEALSRFHLNGFNSLMILSHTPCRPFDARRDGLNLGEGAGYIVMERKADAERRGAAIHGFLSGYGNACDAFHQTASSPNGEGAYHAMADAISMAGLNASAIDYVNAHGTGTFNNDESETRALRRVFGDHMPRVSSTKSATGHTTSASGGIEAVICLLALGHHFIPASLGWQERMPDGITPSQGETHVTLRHVLSNSFGFGGNDSSLLFSSEPTSTDAEASLTDRPVVELSRVEIDGEVDADRMKRYLKPLETRRMGKLTRASLLSSLEALDAAGISCPDAIVTGTAWGCVENSERLLDQLVQGEHALSPTDFMQSTHNTLSSAVAIRLGCHGYNVTISQGDDTLRWCLYQARLLLMSGRYRHVLVGLHDETTPQFEHFLQLMGHHAVPRVKSLSIVLSCGK